MRLQTALRTALIYSLTIPLLGHDGDLADDEKSDGFGSMFNGKDLSGWQYMGKGKGTFSVTDGAIHYKGGGGWLCWTEKEFPDFELRCEFRLIKKGGDGGIFFRASKD